MVINGLQKLTLLDFPGRTACTVFAGGCNFRCPFCHNASLVVRAGEQPVMSEEIFFDFLKKRRGLLDGVCITGGEPTLQPDLPEFLIKIRELGHMTKLDTNGFRPDVLRLVLERGLCDYVAMDIKSSRSRYGAVAGIPGMDISPIRESVSMLMEGKTPFEFRTTVVEELHDVEDFRDIGRWLTGAPQYFVQSFKDSGDVIKEGFSAAKREKLDRIVTVLREYIPSAQLRGVD
ncbi:MAG: anaerobic ribonucleoside-triphosphate reductase activating protein [Oscillospiraceae bacterium]